MKKKLRIYNSIVPVFFTCLSVLLLFGDAKQSARDVLDFITVGIVWIVYISSVRKSAFRPLPSGIGKAWVAVFAIAAVSSVFSVSPGFSLTWIARLTTGYVLYRLFAEVSDSRGKAWYVYGLFGFTGFACFLFALTFVFPRVAAALPPMNLLSVSYGHSNLAGLLVFITPIFWYTAKHMKHPAREAAISLFAAFLVLTLARGAWVLVVSYLLYDFVHSDLFSGRAKRFAALVTIAAVILVGGTLFMQMPRINSPFHAKNETVESRLGYWTQALQAFGERPFLGSGPGTFTLASARLQKPSGQPSWFAHSAPLEIAAELGLLGLAAFSWLVWEHVSVLRSLKAGSAKQDARVRMLISGIILLGAYSLYEYVLDFYVIWLLVAATAGLLIGAPLITPRARGGRGVYAICAILGVFYGLWGLSALAFHAKRPVAAFYLAPYDTVTTLAYLDNRRNPSPDPSGEGLAVWMHRGDSEVRFAYAELLLKRNDIRGANREFAESLSLAPNYAIHKLAYFEFLYAHNLIIPMKQALARWGSTWLNDMWAPRLYAVGLTYVDQNDVQNALPFWRAASEINPSWSQIWVEYAGLVWSLGDRADALHILSVCSKDAYAGAHCRKMRNVFSAGNPPPIGSFRKEILSDRFL